MDALVMIPFRLARRVAARGRILHVAWLAAAAACAQAAPAAAQTDGVLNVTGRIVSACTISTPTLDAPFENVGPDGGGSVTVQLGLYCSPGLTYSVTAAGLYDRPGYRYLHGVSSDHVGVSATYKLYWGPSAASQLMEVGVPIRITSDGSTTPKPIFAQNAVATEPTRYTDTVTLTISY